MHAHIIGVDVVLPQAMRVLLINPRFVKPFVKGSKNDAADAEGISKQPCARRCVSCQSNRPNSRTCNPFIVRVTAHLPRTALSIICGDFLLNMALFCRKALGVSWRRRTTAIADAELSDLAREIFSELLDELGDLDRRLEKLDRSSPLSAARSDACRRLAKLPGVGPVIATALVAAVDDGRHFRSGRELAAWIGLVPRQYTTGGKPRLGGIGRRANHYLRRQMIHGARAVISRLSKHDDRRSAMAESAGCQARI